MHALSRDAVHMQTQCAYCNQLPMEDIQCLMAVSDHACHTCVTRCKAKRCHGPGDRQASEASVTDVELMCRLWHPPAASMPLTSALTRGDRHAVDMLLSSSLGSCHMLCMTIFGVVRCCIRSCYQQLHVQTIQGLSARLSIAFTAHW